MPQGVDGGAQNYGRDGAMRFDSNGGRSKNYEPNSYDQPAPTGEFYDFSRSLIGSTGPQEHSHHLEKNDFVQAGALYLVMKPDARERLVANLSAGLAQVSRDEIIERSIGYFFTSKY